MHLLRDNVEGFGRGFKRGDRDHHLTDRVNIAAGNGLQRDDDLAGDQRGVDGVMRLGGVATQALDLDLDKIGGGKKCTGPNRELTGRPARHVVHAVNFRDVPAVHHPVVDHFAPTAAAFLGRLKDHCDAAVEISGLGQVFRGPHQHRRVPVVAAGVHGAFGF